MDWQLYIVLAVVGLAAVYMVRRWYRTWFGSKQGACEGCHCDHEPVAKGSSRG